MNSENYSKFYITSKELLSLQDEKLFNNIKSFSKKEKVCIQYSKLLSKSPVLVTDKIYSDLKIYFSESEIVAIDYTIAQVNFWARLIQGLKISPEGFSKDCVYDPN